MIGALRRLHGMSDIARVFVTNVPLALLSLALATAIWVAVTNAQNPTLRSTVPFDVPIEAVNIPRTLTVTGIMPSSVRITLIGPRDTIAGVRQGDIIARIDLSTIDTGGASPQSPISVAASVEATVRQRGLRAEVDPATVNVALEVLVERVVPVKVNRVDTLPLGFDLTGPLVSQPPVATVKGSKEAVDAVAAAVADVKLSGQTVSFTQSLPLDPEDSAGHSIGGVTISPSAVTVSVRLHQVLFTRQILIDPQIRGRPAPGYMITGTRVAPETIKVVGTLDILNGISTLQTQDVDVEGATSDVIRTVGVQLPAGASLADPTNSVVVSVLIQAQHGSGSLSVIPRLSGLGAGLIALPQEPALIIDLSGPLPELTGLTPADVSATADLTGLGAGSYRIAPKVTAPAGIQVDAVVPDRLPIIIATPPPAR